MVSKILKLAAVPASLAFTSYGLYAVSDREPKGERLRPTQLSVYSAPLRESRFIEDRPGRVQCAFSALRLGLSPIVTGGKSFFFTIKNGVQDTVQFGKDSYEYLKDPPPEFLPRVGIIAVSGLAGLVLSRRGSRLRKVLYPVGLAGLGASVCYPAQAVIFAKVTGKKLYSAGHWTYDAAASLWKVKPQKEGTPLPPVNKEVTEVAPTEAAAEMTTQEPIESENAEPAEPVTEVAPTEAVAESTTQEPIKAENAEPAAEPEPEPAQPENTPDLHTGSASPEPEKGSKFSPPPNLSDHGQSDPADVDMYSTRS